MTTTTIEVGPILYALVGLIVAAMFNAFTSWLAYRQGVAAKVATQVVARRAKAIALKAEKTTEMVAEIKKDVNSNTAAMVAKLNATEAELKATIKELGEVKARAETKPEPIQPQATVPVPVADKAVEEAVKEMHADLGRKADETLDNTK